MLTSIIEALIFASGRGIPKKEIYEGLKNDHSKREIDRALAAIKEKYSGECGIRIIEFNNTLQMQTNPQYGEILADLLRETKERELSRTLLQVLAIIVYKQPITRTEIEALRGSSPDYVMSMLLKLNLIEPKGRKDAIGHPILYGTTEEFLKKFGISSIKELPQYEEIMQKIRNNYDRFHEKSAGLFKDVKPISDDDYDDSQNGSDIIRNEFIREQNADNATVADGTAASEELDAEEQEDDELPDFLSGEDVITIE